MSWCDDACCCGVVVVIILLLPCDGVVFDVCGTVLYCGSTVKLWCVVLLNYSVVDAVIEYWFMYLCQYCDFVSYCTVL